jgi:hypothetical protein
VAAAAIATTMLLPAFPVASAGQEQPPVLNPETVMRVQEGSENVVLTIRHDILYDGRESVVFGQPGWIAVGPNGRAYVIDPVDLVIRALDEDGRVVLSFGGQGEGPGEFQDAWQIAITPGGRIYVYDRTLNRLQRFTLEGQFVESMLLPVARLDYSQALLAIDERTLLFVGPSLEPALYGNAIHRFRIDRGLDERAFLTWAGEFARTEPFEPIIYKMLAGGRATLDLDGGVLYNQQTPYSLRKYTPNGALLWRIDDPEAFPEATSFFDLTPEGRINVRRFAHSAYLHPVGKNLYFHIMLSPSPDWVSGSLIEPWQRTGELLWIANGELARRVRFQLPEALAYFARDREGRLYGRWTSTEQVLIRSTVTVTVE